MSKLTLTRQQSREVDRIAIEKYGFSGLVLMENAARGVVEVLLDTDPQLASHPDNSVLILCGKGNNAGDGFAIARHLEIRGVTVKVILLASPNDLNGDALANFKILQHSKVPMVDCSKSSAFAAESASADGATWLVDAMLGTGAQGEPREPYAAAIRWMNQQPGRRLAVDMPSGLDCDTGQPASSTVRADLTCSFVAAKLGFGEAAAQEFLGKLRVVSIGTPAGVLNEALTRNSRLPE